MPIPASSSSLSSGERGPRVPRTRFRGRRHRSVHHARRSRRRACRHRRASDGHAVRARHRQCRHRDRRLRGSDPRRQRRGVRRGHRPGRHRDAAGQAPLYPGGQAGSHRERRLLGGVQALWRHAFRGRDRFRKPGDRPPAVRVRHQRRHFPPRHRAGPHLRLHEGCRAAVGGRLCARLVAGEFAW